MVCIMPLYRWLHAGRVSLVGLSLLVTISIGSVAHARTVSHVYGDTRIEGSPERVITLYQGATDTAIANDRLPNRTPIWPVVTMP